MNLPRYDVPIAVAILSPNDGRVRFTDKIDYRGVYLRTDSPPPVNQLIRLKFTLPSQDGGNQDVILNGVVTRRIPPTGMVAAAVEIEFFAKAGDDARRWDAFIDQSRIASVPPESCDRLAAHAPTARPRLVANGS